MMKTMKKIPRKVLHASARRAAPGITEEFEEEPSIKLTSAFVVVVLLHLVALGGVFAFNSIKAKRSSDVETGQTAERVAAAEPAAARSPAVGAGRVYEVKPGDTLIRIANSYGVSLEAIEVANGLRDVEVLRVGQEIRIPEVAAAVVEKPRSLTSAPRADRAPQPASASAPASAADTYTVKKGDNPVAIARHLGVKYSALIELNKIEDPRLLQIGQVLKIPANRD